jgi:leucyl aminopeptidase
LPDSLLAFAAAPAESAVAIDAVAIDRLPGLITGLSPVAAAWLGSTGFSGAAGEVALLPDGAGGIGSVLFGLGKGSHAPSLLPGKLPGVLPAGTYRFGQGFDDLPLASVAWALGAYRFTRYRKAAAEPRRLVLPPTVDTADVIRIADGVALARDHVNTGANDLGPAELAAAADDLARRHGALCRVIVGDALLADGFPLIHAVGIAATPERAPRLVDITWGDAADPKITIVGKGVCFDTGGLDLKPSSGMLLMKKDMGGAANALGLAHMIMDAGLRVRLRVLIPAVENAVSSAAFRPGDVFRSRKGLTVEIGNTDAEGRLILADALALADEETPDLLVDMGTLTGAARVALGPELPPYYTDDETLAADLARHAAVENDPLWRLPLWMRYDQNLDSKVADVNNIAAGGMAGSIICALFLKRFVSAAKSWLHFDIYAWTPAAKPGRPEGGECQAARALYALLTQRYG